MLKNFIRSSLALAIALSISSVQSQQAATQDTAQAGSQPADNAVSPARQIQRRRGPPEPEVDSVGNYRTFDGSNNDLNNPEEGMAETPLARIVANDYADGISELAGADRRSPRAISNLVSAQNGDHLNTVNASDFLWQWGQFLDHDIDLTDGVDPAEPANIDIPVGDSYFDPQSNGGQQLSFNRSIYDTETGIAVDNPRQQLNEITAWVDGSNVYGSDIERADALRKLDGSGELKTSAGNLLPFNTEGFANAGGTSDSLFFAGDVRANEQVGLTVMHTLFVREHNRLARNIKRGSPQLTGEEIYQRARQLVVAMLQAITYEEYLPLLLGADTLAPYPGYRPGAPTAIANVFSTAVYRYGHSALSPQLLRLNLNGEPIEQGHLALRDAFFSPQRLTDEGGIEPVLLGLAAQVCQDIDVLVIDDVRNFLFGNPGEGGFDLAALNIQRGRDHGLPSYNEVREQLGLTKVSSFEDITNDPEISARLADAYDSVDDIDVWVGGLAEDHLPGAMVGELITRVLKRQFELLRNGDRFWYQRTLTSNQLDLVRRSRLSDVIRRNTNIGNQISNNVFRVRP